MAKEGLLLEDMIVTPNLGSRFQFSYYRDDKMLAYYKFASIQDDNILTSMPYQVLTSSIREGPASQNVIPVRETDVVLRTVLSSPATWALKKYPVRLIFRGVLAWEWEVNFEQAVLPFNLDGVWNQG